MKRNDGERKRTMKNERESSRDDKGMMKSENKQWGTEINDGEQKRMMKEW